MDFTVPCDDMPRVVFYANGWGDVLCVIFMRLAVDDLVELVVYVTVDYGRYVLCLCNV
ncbi:hypothetical protein [Paenibacillus sp. FSL L8-0499]|uniref:hypothetical protein n=1 Tax=Paenibacillus sp. FSL L8-0499 TaxID=2975334 RepID=UPI0030F783E1